jgi:gliding motility-associated-like protein
MATTTAPPYISIGLAPDLFTTSRNANFTFTSNAVQFRISLDGGTYFFQSSNSYNLSNLNDGAHTLSVFGIAADGTESAGAARYYWTVDNTAPVVTDVFADGYIARFGEHPRVTVIFDEAVNFTGSASLSIVVGDRTTEAICTAVVNNAFMLFEYTVKPGDNDVDGITVLSPVRLNGGTLKNSTGLAVTTPVLPWTNKTFPEQTINATRPITSITGPAVVTENSFDIELIFTDSLSGLNTYMTDLTASDFQLSGIPGAYVDADMSRRSINGVLATLHVPTPSAGNLTITLPMDAATNRSSLMGNWKSDPLIVEIKNAPPVITAVDLPPDAYYSIGTELDFTVHYNDNVTVTPAGGMPYLPLTIGTKAVQASYLNGSGSNEIRFRYVVQAGDNDADGITLANSLVTSTGIIKNSKFDADNTLNNVGVTTGILVNTSTPTVTLSTTAAAYMNDPFTVQIVFSEPVTDLTDQDFNVTNASLSDLQQVNATTYTISVSPNISGPVRISLPANQVVNVGGNGNTASNEISVTADFADPVITQVDVPANGYYHLNDTLTFTIHYNENVRVDTTAGVPYMAINMDSGTLPAFYKGGSGTDILTFSYIIQDGDIDLDGISLGAGLSLGGGGLIQDIMDNYARLIFNNVANTSGIFVNTIYPTVKFSTTAVKVNSPFTVTVTFSELVAGLALSDFTTTNITLSDLQSVNDTTYTLLVTPLTDGTATISLPADAVMNVGQNGNSESDHLAILYDATAPVITAGQHFDINEHSPVGTLTGTLVAIEATGTLQDWTITSDPSGGAFDIDNNGNIIVKDAGILENRVNTTVTISVSVSDGMNTSILTPIDITIIHVPVAPADIIIDNNSIDERAPIYTVVGNLSAVTAEPGVTFIYTLVTGNGSTDNSSFMIVDNALQTAEVLLTSLKSTYSVRILATDNNGLTIEKVLIITLNFVNQAPILDVINDQENCNNTKAQVIQLTGASPVEAGQTMSFTVMTDQDYFSALTINANGLLSYSPKPGISGTANIVVTIKDNGGTAHGGMDVIQQTFALTIKSLPTVAISSDKGTAISKGDVLHLKASGGDSYTWTNADGIISGLEEDSLTVKPAKNTTYQVTVTNTAGCTNTGEISITVKDDMDVNATNLLTPDGDGINDKWLINNLSSYPNNEVTIYDRAGRIVYHQKNYSNDWMGTINGQPLAEGTYYYILTIKGISHTWKGYISIIRNKY